MQLCELKAIDLKGTDKSLDRDSDYRGKLGGLCLSSWQARVENTLNSRDPHAAVHAMYSLQHFTLELSKLSLFSNVLLQFITFRLGLIITSK